MARFRTYDQWKLMSPEDEEEEVEKKRLRDDAKADRADEEYDRRKDEAVERRLLKKGGRDAKAE